MLRRNVDRAKRATWAITAALLLFSGSAFSQQMVTSRARGSAAQAAAYWTPQRKANAKPMPLRRVSGRPTPASAASINSGQTPAAVPGNLPARASRDRGSAAQAAAYWTPQRKANAKPMPLRRVSGRPTPASAASINSGQTPAAVPGNLPARASRDRSLERALRAVRVPRTPEPSFGPGSTVWYDYPPPFTLHVPILDYFFVPSFPNTALGKLFFSQGGGDSVCSAQSVTSAGTWGAGNRQTVVTAGHCCSDGAGTLSTDIVFEPLHTNGAAPLGSWSYNGFTLYAAWHDGADFSVDYCVLQMQTNSGQNINDAVGALGYSSGLPLPQSYTATGWPAEAPFTGGILFYSNASDAETDTTTAGLLPFTHGIGSSMTKGSSGGGLD